MEVIKAEFDVPIKYMKVVDNRISLTVHRNWLANFFNTGPISFITHDKLTPDEIAAQPTLEELGSDWTKIYAKVYIKQYKNAIPLPRGRRTINTKTQTELTFSQLLHYLSETNYRNLWKESYKKYYNPWSTIEQKEQSIVTFNTTDVTIMQEVIARVYGCSLIHVQDKIVYSVSSGLTTESHCNLLPALFAVETVNAFIIFYEQTAKYSLRECVMYSPAALSTSHGKPLFLIYQLLRLSRDLHDLGLVLGEVTLSDILLMENFTIQVIPKLSDNIYLKPKADCINFTTTTTTETNKEKNHNLYSKKRDLNLYKNIQYGSPEFGINESIEKLCEMWVYNNISNFDYLTALNNLAGRKYGDPSCHHVMPWVTDFTSRCGGNWRDLTKSKFRLNKGDRQLDLTFDSQSTEVGHHVSDVLSEITYYVYLSRRYDKSVLCKHVRPLWVPGEYPASIQRLHDWSPDECIPQFFIDASVFKSIHEDLPDLEIPAWATSPEDFIQKHREALESFYVSERLHHWIDLTFGYKLSGSAAIKSKNVCLQLVDNHTTLTNSGIVQLFTQPHPQKIMPSPYWGKVPPRLRSSLLISKRTETSGGKTSDDEGHSSGLEEEELPVTISNTSRSSPLALSRFLSRSRGSLLAVEDNTKSDKTSNQMIILPKDYNPVAAIQHVETMHTFINKISHKVYKPVIGSQELPINYKQIVASGRIKEQQILGCLIVEIFLSGKFRATWNIEKLSFALRLSACLNVIKLSADSLPKCIRNAVSLLLQVDVVPKSYNIESTETNESSFRYPTITHMGLPPPSAHQFLQPILSGSLFPFSKYCQYLYNVVEMIQEYNSLTRELNLVLKFEEDPDFVIKTKIKYLCKISECKVKAVARELEQLLPHIGAAKEGSLQLIVPHIQQLMKEPYSAVLTTWHLFDPIAKALGPKETADMFLLPIMKLYENGSVMDSSPHADILHPATLVKFRTTLLYHRNFLLILMVRLGLRRFLDNFITSLVEAVGGYRDYVQGSCLSVHRTGNLKSCDLSGTCGDIEGVLSPLDEDSSADSEHNIASSPAPATSDYSQNKSAIDNDAEEVFAMETEGNAWNFLSTSRSYNIDLHMDLNLNLNDDLNEEENKVSPPSSTKSPTIPIPKHSGSGKLMIEVNSIGCDVGSKTSNEDISYNETSGAIYFGSNASDNASNTYPEEPNSITVNQTTLTDDKSNTAGLNNTDNEYDQAYQRSARNECTVSEISAESVIWLSHRLGPVLTARYLSRNLLRMLTLCYAGKENLTPSNDVTLTSVQGIDWKKKILVGDDNAAKVLDCLTAIAGLYGEQIILLQYFAHMAELLTLCKKKLTQNLEGGLLSCLALLNHITQYLSDSALMDALHESIVKAILHPTVRILSTTRFTFPNGVIARTALADKCLEAMIMLSLRLGSAVTKNHLAVPIQRFFLAFDKSFSQNTKVDHLTDDLGLKDLSCSHASNSGVRIKTSNEDTSHGSSQDWNVIETCVSGSPLIWDGFNVEAESYSPPVIDNTNLPDLQRNKAFEELKEVFTTEFAHKAYMLFYKCMGSEAMEHILKNHQHIRNLCHEYEQETRLSSPNVGSEHYGAPCLLDYSISESIESLDKDVNSFGNISVVGNRFEIQKDDSRSQSISDTTIYPNKEIYSSSSGRQLRGNWLAYWEHEIGRPDKETAFNIKQIKLQSFGGHNNSIRCLYVLDNENSFMSGSRDKTVKLWSLRSQGDGSTVSSCQYTYTGHKKSILALTFLESLRYAITCDGAIHCWDPFMGSLLGYPENNRLAPINTLAAGPSPSTNLFVGTTDITLRVIDCRTFQYVNEMKVLTNPTGLIRCIAVAPSGHWIALGQASGFLTILDIRTGLIIASWKGHECEILQLQAVNETTIISSSLDQTIAVWSALDGKLKFHMKGTTEPVHCMATYERGLVIGTTANRIGVYTSIDANAPFSSSKLKSDAFKGVLTAISILPLNRLLLLGADNGGITLLC
ncbi:PREDICTED: WD repeat-containing protein 81 isoform X2 [Polistes dominula]|uniref:WD repeat-containing protein 81 isoform X2 n=1 Tax=Polistes dominula TaxID=743375 RepID=A0ABM1IXB5_POLDO|nr:PREDICTED: WD repeat-containing protein 81 isoform X2 [Polistes dominula]